MRDFTGRQQSDSPLDQHVKMGVLGYFALRPELVGDLSASKNRTDKCPMIIRPFKTVSPKNVAQNLYVRFDLCFSVSPYLSPKASYNKLTSKPLMVLHSGKGRKKQERAKKKKKVLHCGQEGIKETGNIDWSHRNSQKEKTVEQEKIVAWQPVTLSDDTLPTVLSTVNNCVCEMLWRMFCIKKNKMPMCGPMAASPAC